MNIQEMQAIVDQAGFPHITVIDSDNVKTIVDDEEQVFNRDDRVTGYQMSGLRHYGPVYGDHRMIEAIADDMRTVFELIND